jgi:hypothetical protein
MHPDPNQRRSATEVVVAIEQHLSHASASSRRIADLEKLLV